MRACATDRARHLLSTLGRAAARVRTRHVVAVLGRVAAVLICLELVYLIAGNLLLRSQLIQRAVGASEGFALEFRAAYTLWPGHAHVRDLSLRVEDYNVQFEVAIEAAELDIALSELPFKKFHITRLVAEGTRFRMRHKLIVVGEDAERVAAYPKIKGFADPPYYVGVHAPPLSDEEADSKLWKVRVENVEAAVRELWVLEYRYQGPARARGSFVVHPTRWVQVTPAALWLEGGALTLGEHRVAERVTGKLACDIHDMQVQARKGAAVLKDISGSVKLDLEGGGLEFLRAYLARVGIERFGGQASYRIDAAFTGGQLNPRSRVDVRATPFELEYDGTTLRGDVMLTAQREQEPALQLAVSAPELVASRGGAEAALRLEGNALSLTLQGVDFSEELRLGAASVGVTRARADSLAPLAPPGVKLSGAAEASFQLARRASGELSGAARLELRRGALGLSDFGLSGDVNGEVSWHRGPSSDEPFEARKLRVQLFAATLRSGDSKSERFDALVEGAGLRVATAGSASATGTLRARVDNAEALLPLVMGGPLKELTGGALGLERLDAETAIELSRTDKSFRLVDARSGNLRARGYFRQAKRSEPRAAFLFSTGPLNVGVTLSGGETEISPFVGDGWLAATWPRIAASRPGAGPG